MADELNFTIAEANVVPVPVDDTLTIEGQAADAKAVGDALATKANRSELATAITVNDQAADAQGSILVTAEQIPMDDGGESMVAAEIAALKARTGAEIPVNDSTGAGSIEAAVEATAAVLGEALTRIGEMEGTVYGTKAAAVGSLDSITDNGVYWINLANYAGGPVDSGYGYLLVLGNRAGTNKLQVFLRHASAGTARARVWHRNYVNAQWYGWMPHNGELMTKVADGQTSGAGSLTTGLNRTRYAVVSAIAPGYICIPYNPASSNNIYIKVLNTDLTPVASQSVEVAVTYIDMGAGAFD